MMNMPSPEDHTHPSECTCPQVWPSRIKYLTLADTVSAEQPSKATVAADRSAHSAVYNPCAGQSLQ